MADKLLSVSVAAYNMEDYIEECLNSCILPDGMDSLEVLIVDDGSSDNTASIANRYCLEYPDTFKLLQKENGGYGTTVNLGMREARGKYFKLLDADDWFDQDGLTNLLDFLATSDADLILTPYYRCISGKGQVLMPEPFDIPTQQTIPIEQVPHTIPLGMWQICVKNSLIQAHPFSLPGKCIFTDQLFTVNCLAYAQTVAYLTTPVYCYRLGRDGQTVAPEVRLRHFDEIEKVLIEELAFYCEAGETSRAKALLKSVIGLHYNNYLKMILMLPRSFGNLQLIERMERVTQGQNEEFFDTVAQEHAWIKALRMSGYSAYWPLTFLDIKNPKRWGQ